MKMSKKLLNKQQKAAVSHTKGPVLVIAGAGTGKTTVVTERIKHLVADGHAKPSEILGLTFTEKAASEMEERVDLAMPMGYTDMWITTFHGFGDQILRQSGLHIGLDPRFKLLSEAETIQFVRNNLYEFELKYFRPRGKPDKFIAAMLYHFSRLQDEDVSPSQYTKWSKNQAEAEYKELSLAYQKYQDLKEEGGYMDFGDLINNCLELFRKRPKVLADYQNRFKYILVDEFQDVNYAQYQLSKFLAGKQANIMATGDDDQSIYRFRGAAVSNILQFRKDYKTSRMIVLSKNYRSSQVILDSAHALIQHNNPDRLEVAEKISKKLISQRSVKNSRISLIYENRVEDEAEAVVKKITNLIKKSGYEYRDFAILVRANSHADPFVSALQRRNLPHQFLGPGKLFKQSEIVDLISFLKVLYDQNDSQAFFRLLNMNIFKIDPRDLGKLGSFARARNLSFYEAFEYLDVIKISSKEQKKLRLVLELINSGLAKLSSDTAGQIMYDFIENTGYLKKLLDPQNEEVQIQSANISKFFDKLKSYEAEHEDASVFAVVDWINLATELGESPAAATTDWSQNNAVNILTVHSSKGLEFPVVFLTNLVSQRFPTNRRPEPLPIPEDLIKESLPKGDFHLQEERRLAYVGMTRARDQLFLTAADFYGDSNRKKKLSPFVFEALGDQLSNVFLATKNKKTSFQDFKKHNNSNSVNNKKQDLKINFLSYSQIETFRICPLHYKLRYILKIPTRPSAALSFGSSMHKAMQDFYSAVSINNKPSEKLILDCLHKNWISVGYESKSHEKDAFEGAQKMLKEYLCTSFDKGRIPIALEQSFKIRIASDLKIGGKIDRIDDLGNGKIEIVDYKTGERVPDQKEVDKNMQMTLYALAAEEIYKKKPEQIKLSLYYFEEQKKLSTTRNSKDLDGLKQEILKIRDEIENSDFKCSGHYICQTGCEYSMFCNPD